MSLLPNDDMYGDNACQAKEGAAKYCQALKIWFSIPTHLTLAWTICLAWVQLSVPCAIVSYTQIIMGW